MRGKTKGSRRLYSFLLRNIYIAIFILGWHWSYMIIPVSIEIAITDGRV